MSSADNIQNLKKFYKILTPNVIYDSTSSKTYQKVKKLLFDEIAYNSTIIDASSLISRQVHEYRDSEVEIDKPLTKKFPAILYKKLDGNKNVLFQVMDQNVNVQLRFVEDVDLFMNGIPTVVMSQCIPYFDVVFEFEDYLINEKDSSKTTKRRLNNEFNLLLSPEQAYNKKNKRFGMEYFTMPQSLNTDIILSEVDRKNKNLLDNIPVDNYRPLITIESFSIDSINPAGFFAFKNATATIKITDKTKIKNFIQFFKGENYSKTSVYVTYGWVCPAKGLNNPYADFINQKMLRKELYGIGNSSYSFEGDGAVSVNLNLFSKFSKEIQNIPIGCDIVDIKRMGILQSLSNQISETTANASENVRAALFGIDSITKEEGEELLQKKLLSAAEGGQSYIGIEFESVVDIIREIEQLEKNSAGDITKIKSLLIVYILTILAKDETSVDAIRTQVEGKSVPNYSIDYLSSQVNQALQDLDLYTDNINDFVVDEIYWNETDDQKSKNNAGLDSPSTISNFLKTRLAFNLSKLFDSLTENTRIAKAEESSVDRDKGDHFYWIFASLLLKLMENDQNKAKKIKKILYRQGKDKTPRGSGAGSNPTGGGGITTGRDLKNKHNGYDGAWLAVRNITGGLQKEDYIELMKKRTPISDIVENQNLFEKLKTSVYEQEGELAKFTGGNVILGEGTLINNTLIKIAQKVFDDLIDNDTLFSSVDAELKKKYKDSFINKTEQNQKDKGSLTREQLSQFLVFQDQYMTINVDGKEFPIINFINFRTKVFDDSLWNDKILKNIYVDRTTGISNFNLFRQSPQSGENKQNQRFFIIGETPEKMVEHFKKTLKSYGNLDLDEALTKFSSTEKPKQGQLLKIAGIIDASGVTEQQKNKYMELINKAYGNDESTPAAESRRDAARTLGIGGNVGVDKANLNLISGKIKELLDTLNKSSIDTTFADIKTNNQAEIKIKTIKTTTDFKIFDNQYDLNIEKYIYEQEQITTIYIDTYKQTEADLNFKLQDSYQLSFIDRRGKTVQINTLYSTLATEPRYVFDSLTKEPIENIIQKRLKNDLESKGTFAAGTDETTNNENINKTVNLLKRWLETEQQNKSTIWYYFYKDFFDDETNKNKSADFLLELNDLSARADAGYDAPIPTSSKSDKKNYGFCSFGSIFTTLVQHGIGISTSALKNTDIQIISYCFNEKSGPILSNLPIMMMPVNLNQFRYEFAKQIFQKKDMFMTIEEFLSFFFEHILNDPRSITNPVSEFYPEYDHEDQQVVPLSESELKEYLTKSEPVVIPQLAALVETLIKDQQNGEFLVTNGDSTFIDDKTNKKILRIHIFDKTKNPYDQIKNITFFNNGSDPTFKVDYEHGSNIYNFLQEEKDAEEYIKFEKGRSNIALRNFLSKKVPVIQIGHTTSNVTSISITSNQNPRDTANRVTQYYKSDTNIGGNLKNNDIFNLPIRIVPANLSMTTVGCPLPEIGQYYYIDLGTGTSLDSLYMVSKVSHTFGQGKFETNLEFVPKDGLAQFEQAIINRE